MRWMFLAALFCANSFGGELNDGVEVKNSFQFDGIWDIKAKIEGKNVVYTRINKDSHSLEIVSLDPVADISTTLLHDDDAPPSYIAQNDIYIAYQTPSIGNTSRIKIFRKKDHAIFNGNRIRDRIIYGYLAEEKLFLFQNSTKVDKIIRTTYQLPLLKFLREDEFGDPGVFTPWPDGFILRDAKYISLINKDMKPQIKSEIPREGNMNSACDMAPSIQLGSTVVFLANCGAIYTFSTSTGEVAKRLRLPMQFYSIATDGQYIFAIPELMSREAVPPKAYIIDSATWKPIREFDAVGSGAIIFETEGLLVKIDHNFLGPTFTASILSYQSPNKALKSQPSAAGTPLRGAP